MRITILTFLLFIIMSVPAHAQDQGSNILFVAPSRIVIPAGETMAEINVSNNSDMARRYDITVVDQVMGADGMTSRVEHFDYSAARMLRFVPKRFTLKPGERQTIRVMAQRPQSLGDGDYHSHMLFREVPLTDLDKAHIDTDRATGQGAQFEIRTLFGVAVPVIVQVGTIQSGIGLGAVSYIPAADGAHAHLAVELTRTGNAEASGRLKVTMEKPGAAPIPLIEELWIPIYREQTQITRRLALPQGINLSGATVTLSLTPTAPADAAVMTKKVEF
jgi:hypothetical protein